MSAIIDAPAKPTILVVDDAPENIDVLAEILRPLYKVKVAINGAKALTVATSNKPPDLILLDIMMPGMSGYQVCVALKDNLATRRVPVIFCTAMGEVEDEKRGFEVGCVDYISKPVSPQLVLARVKTHLSLSQVERDLERKVAERTAEVIETRLAIIKCLGKAAEYKDDQTGHHVVRMAHFSRLLGAATGMADADVDLLFQAAPMHDVGKIGVPDHILKKPGKLDAEEWAIMQKHVDFGVEILIDQRSELLQLASIIAHTHHEKWNGSGYPRKLAGEDIPLVGRIVAIADVYDALRSVRPYKPEWPLEKVVKLFEEERGRHFDPRLIDLMMPLLPQFEEITAQYRDQPGDAAAADGAT